MTPQDPALLKELERQRTRLLDLSASNRLLHFRHTARTSLRLVDELPGLIFERLSNHRARGHAVTGRTGGRAARGGPRRPSRRGADAFAECLN
ncbi:DUF4011 domain-containing protein [Corallococcus sp. ZKHCc1 1396]|uniref:DUF4011 domain-containing protein n=1 Tax=Corallococcus soli TaxID=2710757 RepID=A0ABR9PUG6_9BACT|nr:DUF4011 domain-containing protein [Corallococcus soli]